MNNVSIKTVLHTIREAPMEAALRCFDQHKAESGVVAAMESRIALDVLSLQRRVARLETELLRMKKELS